MFDKDKSEVFLKYLQKIRKNIPEKYNQVELLDYLTNDKVDLLFSITTRGDGKSFNYLYALAKLNISFDFSTIIIVRHLEVRSAMVQQIQDVYMTMKDLNPKKFGFRVNPDYIQITYSEKVPFIICDLNNANDLKNYSSVLRHCNLMLYDEFLAVGGDYAPHEFLKFKTIFETMDRSLIESMEYTNNRRKAIFLANPVDFSSEFLAEWKLYHALETQKMNSIRVYKNIAIERRKNKNTQKNKNNRIFNNNDNESISGVFNFNKWAIKEPNKTTKKITIKTGDKFINVYFSKKPILDVVSYETSYDYNTDLKDNCEQSTYLKDSFFNDNFYKKYTNDKFLFANQFSKMYILNNYPTLNFNRLIRKNKKYSINDEDIQRKINDLELTKKRLFEQYF